SLRAAPRRHDYRRTPQRIPRTYRPESGGSAANPPAQWLILQCRSQQCNRQRRDAGRQSSAGRRRPDLRDSHGGSQFIIILTETSVFWQRGAAYRALLYSHRHGNLEANQAALTINAAKTDFAMIALNDVLDEMQRQSGPINAHRFAGFGAEEGLK